MNSVEYSRPAALAAKLAATNASMIEHLFASKHILLRLEEDLGEVEQARETLTLLANEVLRFCPNIIIELPTAAHHLYGILQHLAAEIHGDSRITRGGECSNPDATVSIGTEIRAVPNWITINADGWLSRCATSNGTAAVLPRGYTLANPFGALGAACLGAGQAFLALIGRALLPDAIEISLYTLQQSRPGELAPGPELGPDRVLLDVLLIGCGGVGNGWTYAIGRAPASGRVEAVDHQALRPENIGPYVCATGTRLKTPKAQIAKEELEPYGFTVIPRAERFRFFQARFGYGQSYVPEIVISALDKPHTRHMVQRLWAPLTIDLAAEELTSQLVVKRLDDTGMCLIEAHTDLAGEQGELVELAAATGLTVERLRNFESLITEEDIVAAAPGKQPGLEQARQRGRPICGRVGDLALNEEEYSAEFTPAVPFVTAFTGIVAAAQTVKAKLEPLASLHFQFSFSSYRSRILKIHSVKDCECNRHHLPQI